jgi:hypothetical protein
MMPPLSILDAVNDSAIFAKWFRDSATWQAWFAFPQASGSADEALAAFPKPSCRGDPPHEGACSNSLQFDRRSARDSICESLRPYP